MSSMIADDSETMDTAMDPNFDYMFKVLLVGNSGVGKTAFVTRYCDDHFNPAFISTVGIDFRVKNLIRYGKALIVCSFFIKLQIKTLLRAQFPSFPHL